MDIQCPGCGSLNAFNTDEITQSGKRIECNNCKLPFLIRPQQSPSGQVEAKDRVMVANANPPFRDAIRDFLAGNGFEVFGNFAQRFKIRHAGDIQLLRLQKLGI